jgi:hypothetical protein
MNDDDNGETCACVWDIVPLGPVGSPLPGAEDWS